MDTQPQQLRIPVSIEYSTVSQARCRKFGFVRMVTIDFPQKQKKGYVIHMELIEPLNDEEKGSRIRH